MQGILAKYWEWTRSKAYLKVFTFVDISEMVKLKSSVPEKKKMHRVRQK